MRRATGEWIEKAEGDFASARRECRARRNPNYDAACFHAQQCAEKYLKAWLQEKGISFPKTHDLVRLLDAVPASAGLMGLRSGMAILTAYAVEFRYPGESASREVAREALDIAVSIRNEIRGMLALI